MQWHPQLSRLLARLVASLDSMATLLPQSLQLQATLPQAGKVGGKMLAVVVVAGRGGLESVGLAETACQSCGTFRGCWLLNRIAALFLHLSPPRPARLRFFSQFSSAFPHRVQDRCETIMSPDSSWPLR